MVDFRAVPRLAGLDLFLEVDFRAEDVFPRVALLLEGVRPLVFLELFLAPDRLLVERDWAAAFRRRATAPTPTAPAAPAATSEAGAAAPLATRAAPLMTLFALLCFFLKIAIPLPPP